jgi:hypothetical protein
VPRVKFQVAVGERSLTGLDQKTSRTTVKLVASVLRSMLAVVTLLMLSATGDAGILIGSRLD